MSRSDYIPASVKLRTWAPQFLMIAVGTGAGMGIAAISSVIAMVPLVVLSALSWSMLIVTSFIKSDEIARNGWPEFNRPCVRCRSLEADLKKERLEHGETRNALVELKIP